MEVIKEGNIIKKNTKCPNCESELLYTDADVNHECKFYELGHIESWWITCPLCGHQYDPEYRKHHPYIDKPWWKFW